MMEIFDSRQAFEDMARSLVASAHRAGQAIMVHYGGAIATERKADDSPVTKADRDAEAIILADLEKIAPQIPVIAEEKAAAGDIPETRGSFFLVDPLDGTKEFISQRDEFTVNIALVDNRRPVMGVVYAPALGLAYATFAPDQAVEIELPVDQPFPSTGDLNWRKICARPCPREGLIVVTSRSHMDEQTEDYLNDRPVASTKPAGSSIKFCLVAKGEADLYPRFGPTMEWDTAAGDAVLSAAGGMVRGIDGSPFLYSKQDKKFANPGFIATGLVKD